MAVYNRETGSAEQKLRPCDLRGWAEVYMVTVGVHLPTFLDHWHSSKDKAQIRRPVVFIRGSGQWVTVTERTPTLFMLTWRIQHTSPSTAQATQQFH